MSILFYTIYSTFFYSDLSCKAEAFGDQGVSAHLIGRVPALFEHAFDVHAIIEKRKNEPGEAAGDDHEDQGKDRPLEIPAEERDEDPEKEHRPGEAELHLLHHAGLISDIHSHYAKPSTCYCFLWCTFLIFCQEGGEDMKKGKAGSPPWLINLSRAYRAHLLKSFRPGAYPAGSWCPILPASCIPLPWWFPAHSAFLVVWLSSMVSVPFVLAWFMFVVNFRTIRLTN